jgi:Fe-S cluster biogenesis protein NfuA/nitrite reductase/ring-hydroxylating ferredoxin subunit
VSIAERPATQPSTQPPSATFEELALAVDRAAEQVTALEGDARERALELQRAIEAFHKPALVHIVRTLRDDPSGKELLFELVDDPNVHAVLALHGIVRADPMTRGERALATVRPYLQSHGGDVELVRIEGDTAFVRLHGSCSGCSMSAVTLREGVEEALVRMVDEVARIEVLEDQPTAAFIPLSAIGRKPGAVETGWVRALPVGEVAPGTMVRFDVEIAPATSDDPAHVDSFVVTNIDSRIAVFRNECVHQGLSLDGGSLADGVITCPWHGFRFDASSGECISAPNAQLSQIPTRIDDGHVWIRAHGA